MSYDIDDEHWAYVRLISEDNFTGVGMDLRGHEFPLDDLTNVDLVLRILEREGYVRVRQESQELADSDQ